MNNYFIKKFQFLSDYTVNPDVLVNPKTIVKNETVDITPSERNKIEDRIRKEKNLQPYASVNIPKIIRTKKEDILYLDLFKKDGVIDFKPGLNVIVGDNGSGKTTLLNIISKYFKNPKLYEKEYLIESENNFNVCVCDFENDTLKNIKPNPDDVNFIINSLLYMFANQMSHGENVIDVLNIYLKSKNNLLLFDEPETALSLRNQYIYFNKIMELSKINQIVMNTHSKVFIEECDEVFVMDEKKWMKSNDYLNSLKNLL